MKKHTPEAQAHVHAGDGLVRVAFWQFMAFGLLLLMIWVNELLDLKALWFDTPARPPDYLEAGMLSAIVLTVAIIAVGHTYEQQKRIISGLLTVCAHCHKIRLDQEMWEQIEEYISDHSVALITHGICPECFAQLKKEIEAVSPKK